VKLRRLSQSAITVMDLEEASGQQRARIRLQPIATAGLGNNAVASPIWGSVAHVEHRQVGCICK